MRARLDGALLAAALIVAFSSVANAASAGKAYVTPYGYYLFTDPATGLASTAQASDVSLVPPPPVLPPAAAPVPVAAAPVPVADVDQPPDDTEPAGDDTGPWGGWLSEFRLGILAHNIGPIASAREDGAQINAELRFKSPPLFEYILSPRPHIGASINTAGDTSFLYLGLTWTWNITDALFLDLSFGGAIHDGWLTSHEPEPDRRLMGSRLLFRESLELGYRFFDRHSLSLMLDHVSNAGLSHKNQGNDDVGLRYGYRF